MGGRTFARGAHGLDVLGNASPFGLSAVRSFILQPLCQRSRVPEAPAELDDAADQIAPEQLRREFAGGLRGSARSCRAALRFRRRDGGGPPPPPRS